MHGSVGFMSEFLPYIFLFLSHQLRAHIPSNYECDDSDQDALYLFDGANSLAGEGWSNKILSVQCGISVD